MGTTYTTASVAFQSSTNDVLGKTLSESNLRVRHMLPWMGVSYVSDGSPDYFDASTRKMTYALVSGRTFNYGAGYVCIFGMTAYVYGGTTLTAEASATNYVWLQLVRDALQNVTGARYVVTTVQALPTLPTYAMPGDQVMLGQVVAGASTITSQNQTHRGIIAPGREIAFGLLTADASQAIGSSTAGTSVLSTSVVGDGVGYLDIEAIIKSTYGNVAGGGFGWFVSDTTGANPISLSGATAANVIDEIFLVAPGVNYRMSTKLRQPRVSPFIGLRTFYLRPWVTNAATIGISGATQFGANNTQAMGATLAARWSGR